MEIDITDFFLNATPHDYSASAAELGPDAGKITWDNALNGPKVLPENATDDLREYMRGFGAWDDSEIDAWTYAECNAMLVQEISAQMREADLSPYSNDDDWKDYQYRAERGTVSGAIYRGNDGRVYFYLGN